MRACDVRVRVPMSRGTDSLNVATAAALAFYERVRVGSIGCSCDGGTDAVGTGLTVAGFVAAVTGAAIVVLSLGMIRVHPLVAVGLNLVAVGGLAPTPVGLASGTGSAMVRARGRHRGGRRLAHAVGPGRQRLTVSARRWSAPEQDVLPGRDRGLPLPRLVRAGLRASGSASGSSGAAGTSSSSCAIGATGRSGRSKFGLINSLALSSTAVTVPPWAPG